MQFKTNWQVLPKGDFSCGVNDYVCTVVIIIFLPRNFQNIFFSIIFPIISRVKRARDLFKTVIILKRIIVRLNTAIF